MAKVTDGRRNNKPPNPAKKGEVRNPKGGKPKMPEGLKHLKNLTGAELVEALNLIVRGQASALQRIANDKNATALEKMIGGIVSEIITTGNMHAFDKLLDRLVGKVPDNFTFTGNTTAQVVIQLPSNGREAKDGEPTE